MYKSLKRILSKSPASLETKFWFLLKKKKTHIFYVGILLGLCLFSTVINWIPEGYVVATGDKYYQANIQSTISRNFYSWGHSVGEGYTTPSEIAESLRGGLCYFLFVIGFSDSQVQNIIYFSFLFLSGISMYVAIGLLFKDGAPFTRFVVSVFYVFNHFTMDAVTSTGAFVGYFDLYIFLPLIWAFFIVGLINKRPICMVGSAFFVLFSVAGFGNIAFLFVLYILLAITTILLTITRLIKVKQVFLSVVMFSLSLLFISFYLLPYASFYLDGSIIGQSGSSEQIQQWISWQSTSALEPLRLSRNYPIFPIVYPYADSLQPIFILLSFYPAILISLALLSIKRNKSIINNLLLLISGILFLVSVFGVSKTYISKELSFLIFTIPPFSALRSSDKFFVLLPLLVSISLYYLMQHRLLNFKAKKQKIFCIVLLLGIILLYPAPFYRGKFNQDVSINSVWDYRYDTMVKMPSYYKEMANFVNIDASYSKILNLPFSGEIGVGWVLRPQWRYIGVDFTNLYYNNPVISPVNTFGQFQDAITLVNNPNNASLLIDYVKSRGIKYLLVNEENLSEQRFSSSIHAVLNGITAKNTSSSLSQLNDKSVLHYSFDNIYNNTVFDLSGYNNTGIIIGNSTEVAGYLNNGLEFTNGTAVEIENFQSITGASEISFSFWIKPYAFSNWNILINKEQVFKVELNEQSLIKVYFGNGTYWNVQWGPTTSGITLGEWNYLVITYSSSTGVLNLYVNGNLLHSESVAPVTIGTNTQNLYIGSDDRNKYFFNGVIDDVMIFNQTLTESEVVSFYHSENLIFTFEKSFGNLTLYKILPEEEIPIIYGIEVTEEGSLFNLSATSANQQNIDVNFAIFNKKNSVAPISSNSSLIFQKINPTKYYVTIENVTEPFWLIFSESYHTGWKTYLGRSEVVELNQIVAEYPGIGVKQAQPRTTFELDDVRYLLDKPISDDHILANDYANAWYIDPSELKTDSNGNITITLYFQPQSYYYLGIIILLISVFCCTLLIMWYWRKKLVLSANRLDFLG